MSQMTVSRRYSSRGYYPTPMYRDLVETQTYLERLRAEQPRVAEHFDLWSRHRKSTIDTVDSLKNKIDALCVGCNVVRGVGAAVGIAGLLAGLIGEVLDANEHESASKFKEASKYCAGAGAAAVVTSTLLEIGLSQSAINEIKRVLKKDTELTLPLRNWIQFSHEIDSRFSQLFQCDIVSDTFYNVMKVCGQCIKLLNSGGHSVEDIIRSLKFGEIEGVEDLAMEISDKVINFFQGMLINPELLQPMKEICTILQEDPHTLELAKTGIIIYSKISGRLQSEFMNRIFSVTGISLPNLGGSVLLHCALNAIALASHVFTIITSVKNIQEGQSKYSEALDGVKFALLSELTEVNKQMGRRVQFLEMDYGDSFELYNAKLAIR